MGKYLLLMYNKEMPMPKNPTKAQMEAGMKPWRDYLTPLQFHGKSLSSKGAKDYKGAKIDISGYMIIKAKNMAEALKIAQQSPHAKTNMGSTIVREIVEVQM
jgi:YCII-related domain